MPTQKLLLRFRRGPFLVCLFPPVRERKRRLRSGGGLCGWYIECGYCGAVCGGWSVFFLGEAGGRRTAQSNCFC